MRSSKRSPKVEVRKRLHLCNEHRTVWAGIVETARGAVYFCAWTRDEPPTESEVLDVWRTDRAAFLPGYGG